MISPSCIVTAEDQRPVVEEEVEGMYSLSNAYEGDYQEFFEGRPTPINSAPGAAWEEIND